MKRSLLTLTAALSAAWLLSASAAHAQVEELAASADVADKTTSKAELQVGTRYYISADVLNLRAAPSSKAKSLGLLSMNDEVEIMSLNTGDASMVEVKLIKTNSVLSLSLGQRLYLASDFLSIEPIQNAIGSNQLSKYIVIQNVATERMRVYERCTATPGCANRLVFETEMVVGRPEGTKEDKTAFLTWLGRFKIVEWIKFYEDNNRHYPAWYNPNYPAVPKAGAGASKWLNKKYTPNPEEATARGAFGWYAAMIGPQANSQWIHGTFGWGSDGDKFIDYTRNFFVNVFGDPRSSGCTRLENRAIAYARHLLPPGTEILRVYALEGFRDRNLMAYQGQKDTVPWNFILTKEGYQRSGPSADAASVLKRNVSQDQYIETGSYNVDQYPTAVPLKKNAGKTARNSGKSGNSYGIPDSSFRGVLLIDEGKFVGYQHPAGLQVGGYPDKRIPESLQTSGPYTLATK